MKKIMLLLIIGSISIQLYAQKYITKSGHIKFYSEAPLENIEANNHQVTSIMDAATGEMVFKVLMKSFQFEKALMQEHFNEKYVESDKFPEATFKGKVVNFDQIKLDGSEEQKVKVAGELTIHGITHPIEAEGTLKKDGEKIIGHSVFPVTVDDYKIKIPAVLRDNIAEVVEVTVDLSYDPLKK